MGVLRKGAPAGVGLCVIYASGKTCLTMKKCKSCQSEIDDKAKKCPHCQADQRNWFMRHKILTGIAAAALFLLFIAMANSPGSNSSSQLVGSNGDNATSGQSQETKDAVYKIGDQIQLGNAIITVNSVEYSQGGQYTKPVAGNEWINLNVTIENTSSEQQYVTTLGQMFVRDGEGNSYQIAVTNKALENPGLGLDGAIIAKSKRTGWVGFEIKKGASGLQFQYNASMWGSKNILVDLGR